ncbi:MAG: SBBP repeat-containing protein [Thermoplasmata archaeon]|nr:MAG: SBBP repeat-containing protein [Thermoplasmata archaeon]
MRTTARNCIMVLIALAMAMPTGMAMGVTDSEPAETSPKGDEPQWAVPQTEAEVGRFIENLGQWDTRIGFTSVTPFGTAAFGPDGVTYDVMTDGGGHRVKVAFSAPDPVGPEGIGDLGYGTSFFLGNDPDRWVTDARSYAEVVYQDVWPGTDVRYYFSGGNLKYDLILDGGADPSMARFLVRGADDVTAGADGLRVDLDHGLTLHDTDLVAWHGDGEVADVDLVQDGCTYGFSVDKEPGRSMVIDPVVVHSSTFVGGTYPDSVIDVELDGDGNIYTLAYTQSDDFPLTLGAYDDELGASDAAVTKFNHNCSQVLWSTFVGGSSWDGVVGMELDRDNNVYFTGSTWSHDYPYTKGALNGQFNLGMNNYQQDPFVTKLNSQGDDLVYSTYVGGSHTEWVGDIKVNEGLATVVGQTQSGDFPTEYGSYGGVHGDGFLFTLDENGSHIVDTFFWGGFGSEVANCLVFAPNGDIVVGGRTTSMDMFTTPGVFQPTRPCFSSGFICLFTPYTGRMVLSTYFGGGYSTSPTSLVLDDDENIYVAGTTFYSGPGARFITTPGAYQEDYHGRIDSFLAKLNPNATALEWCTLLGGDADDTVYDVELDPEGHLVAVGSVGDGTNFTVTPDCLDDEWEGESEGFVFIINDNGTAPLYSTFYGGHLTDGVYAVEVDDVDNLVIAGTTESMDIPVTEDGYQLKPSGDGDGFVSIVGEYLPTSAPLNLEASGGEGFIQLDWEFPEENSGYPVKRFLLYRGTSQDDLRFYKDVGTVNLHNDKDVEWGVEYYYAVYANNGKGISPRSNVVHDRSVTVPDPPINLTATLEFDAVVLEWEVPEFTGGLPITGFMVYRIAEGDHVEVVTPIPGDSRTFHDTAVEDGTNYTYALTTLNEHGESREPISVSIRTFGVTTQPMNVTHTYGDLFIELTWDAPMDDYGLPVSGYSVYRRLGDALPAEVGRTDPEDPTFRDEQVEVGVLYEYHITAWNGKGESLASDVIEAMAMVPPDAPTGVEAVATEDYVKVTWSAPEFDGASPILGYRVYLGESVDDAVPLGGPSNFGIAQPLLQFLHDVAYDGVVRSYFVTALNAEGESASSAVAVTQVYRVPEAPSDLGLEWGDGTIEVTWGPPVDDGGTPVMGYTLHRRVEGEESFTPLISLAVDELGYTDLDLVNGLEYAYALTARNLAGESGMCPAVMAVPAGLPGVPLDLLAVAGIGSVEVTWDMPDDDGGHPMLGYRLLRMEEGGVMMPLSEIGPTTTHYSDTEVDNAVVYTYCVVALTDAGESERSEMASAMPYGTPGDPLNLVAHWVDGQVQISWSAPGYDGGREVLGYRVYRHDREAGNMTEVTGPALSLVDGEVELGVSYNYTVFAYNEAGQGPGREVRIDIPPPEADPPKSSEGSQWGLLVIALVLFAVAALLIVMRGRGGIPGQAIL